MPGHGWPGRVIQTQSRGAIDGATTISIEPCASGTSSAGQGVIRSPLSLHQGRRNPFQAAALPIRVAVASAAKPLLFGIVEEPAAEAAPGGCMAVSFVRPLPSVRPQAFVTRASAR